MGVNPLFSGISGTGGKAESDQAENASYTLHTSADVFALYERTPLNRSLSSLLVLIADHSIAVHASDTMRGG
jgi:hypothetical protein